MFLEPKFETGWWAAQTNTTDEVSYPFIEGEDAILMKI